MATIAVDSGYRTVPEGQSFNDGYVNGEVAKAWHHIGLRDQRYTEAISAGMSSEVANTTLLAFLGSSGISKAEQMNFAHSMNSSFIHQRQNMPNHPSVTCPLTYSLLY